MQTSYTRTSLNALLLTAAALIIAGQYASAQSAGAPGHFPFKDAGDSARAVALVQRYLSFTQDEPLPVDSIGKYAVDELFKWLDKSHGVPIRFPDKMPYHIVGARSVRTDGTLLSVAVATDAGTLPLFGALGIDWVFFVRPVDGLGWRINSIRRQNGLEDYADQLRYLDTSKIYPAKIKPVIANETSRSLLDNEQLRAHFAAHRDAFTALTSYFNREDSLWMLGRMDLAVTQLNKYGIDWGKGAQVIPPDVVADMMQVLEPDQRVEMRDRLAAAASQHRKGRDTLARIARRIGIDLGRIDSLTAMMRDLRVSFINARLPWKGAVQLTVGGHRDDVLGYLYTPDGELPWISPDEYFYLEDLGNGWWIFRAT